MTFNFPQTREATDTWFARSPPASLLLSSQLPAQIKPLQQAIPTLEPFDGLRRCRKRINISPSFRRRAPLQILMWPHMIVKEAELHQRIAEFLKRSHRPLIQLVLQCPEETLDAPILPGATRISALMPNTQQPQPTPKQPRTKHRFIIRAHSARLAVLADG